METKQTTDKNNFDTKTKHGQKKYINGRLNGLKQTKK